MTRNERIAPHSKVKSVMCSLPSHSFPPTLLQPHEVGQPTRSPKPLKPCSALTLRYPVLQMQVLASIELLSFLGQWTELGRRSLRPRLRGQLLLKHPSVQPRTCYYNELGDNASHDCGSSSSSSWAEAAAWTTLLQAFCRGSKGKSGRIIPSHALCP